VYAVSFFAIPAVRMVLNIQRNAKLEAANQNRNFQNDPLTVLELALKPHIFVT
jgi:hypothetical protein